MLSARSAPGPGRAILVSAETASGPLRRAPVVPTPGVSICRLRMGEFTGGGNPP
jgi:hypothetical protein